MKRFYLFAITLLSLASCQQEDIATNGMYSDAFMSKLKFNTINVSKTRAFDNGKDAEESIINDNSVKTTNAGVNIGIFSVRIARPSTDCVYGFGFCDFVWFPKQNNEVDFRNNHLYDNSFEVKCDSEGNKFVDMELLEVPKNIDISKLQPLVVEDSLESIRTIDGKEKEVVVPMGTYVFDRTIGKYGGYRIPLK
ncbi:MAG: hypothetical protein HXO29_08125 [Prevotella sp.]|nr:hypothetical protein [Prevotella sp.]